MDQEVIQNALKLTSTCKIKKNCRGLFPGPPIKRWGWTDGVKGRKGKEGRRGGGEGGVAMDWNKLGMKLAPMSVRDVR